MEKLDIKSLVKDTKVRFLYYRKGELWYEVFKLEYWNDRDGERGYDVKGLFQFPVEISDCGDGKFLAEDKAMLFLRYIRKQLEKIEAEK